MRVLITGATGFLGQHLVRGFEKRETQVISLGRTDRIECAISGVQVAIHLSAQTEVGKASQNPSETLEANVGGTWRFLEACRKARTPRVIVASSDKAYGDGSLPYMEDQLLKPHGIYATSKACADFIAQAYAFEYELSIAITRCSNLYGPGHLNWSCLIPGTIRSCLKGEPIVIRSDGTPKREYLYVEDAVDAYLRLASSQTIGPFNLGSGSVLSALDLAEEIKRLCKSSSEIVIENSSKGEIQNQWLDSSRAKDEFGWKPKTMMTEGLTKTIAWYKEFLK